MELGIVGCETEPSRKQYSKNINTFIYLESFQQSLKHGLSQQPDPPWQAGEAVEPLTEVFFSPLSVRLCPGWGELQDHAGTACPQALIPSSHHCSLCSLLAVGCGGDRAASPLILGDTMCQDSETWERMSSCWLFFLVVSLVLFMVGVGIQRRDGKELSVQRQAEFCQ